MDDQTKDIIARAVERAPLWLRNDFVSKDAGVRRTAEETITSMIINALAAGTGEGP
ncbi:hypothetical protein U5A82_02815 [Sphingobium sp. CR2-8]|uniref:hypothetical protein n=1 Tax=Sphingobium sp. CR2-8 TaxID=1306534 RepID=UPI002DB7CC1D|nr:hypothetical protein [Sphingobium sp. CR2-8]MEC3909440.1 hypothetical protein [Sphingobium sp. CR2-8]